MHWRKRDIKWVAAWASGFLLLGACVVWLIHHEEERQLERSAEQSALQWAQFAEYALPPFAEFRPGAILTPQTFEQLQRMGSFRGIFLFKLFDKNGDQVFSSDDLNRLDNLLLPIYSDKEGIGSHHNGGNRAHIRNSVLAGKSVVELSGETKAGRPAIYSEAYVPVRRDGAIQGVVEVYVDQTAVAGATRASFARVALLGGGLLLALMGLAVYQSWRRLRSAQRSKLRFQEMAHRDALTGAMNRTSLNELLTQVSANADQGGPQFALVCIDLDNFKEINDTLGHAKGDDALCEAHRRLADAVREEDAVARLGGDEFAVVLMGVDKRANASLLATRIVLSLGQPFVLDGKSFELGGCAGIALSGQDAGSPKDLLVKADLALYRAKAQGRGLFQFYDAQMETALQSRREMARDLAEALERHEFELHYQPLFWADAQTLTGYEALLRWNHPMYGQIGPADFIPLAEENGLIGEIGQWVLAQACRDAATWPDTLAVHVNLSPAQFADANLPARILQILRRTGLPARRLGLEITESLLVNNVDHVGRVLNDLGKAGIKLAMDDFGTGYSSLAYLWRLPFSKVKIDRAFTSNLGSQKVDVIVSSIVSLAHSLGIRVNAEGVETEAQIHCLQKMGCDELQGFKLGKPQPNGALTHTGHLPRIPAEILDEGPRESLFVGLEHALPMSRHNSLDTHPGRI